MATMAKMLMVFCKVVSRVTANTIVSIYWNLMGWASKGAAYGNPAVGAALLTLMLASSGGSGEVLSVTAMHKQTWKVLGADTKLAVLNRMVKLVERAKEAAGAGKKFNAVVVKSIQGFMDFYCDVDAIVQVFSCIPEAARGAELKAARVSILLYLHDFLS